MRVLIAILVWIIEIIVEEIHYEFVSGIIQAFVQDHRSIFFLFFTRQFIPIHFTRHNNVLHADNIYY